jgi:uncharacterized protein Yka (UPF0111/DUF47 family)
MATVLAANAHDLAGLLEHPPASEDELHAMRERDRRGVRLHRQLSARIATSYMVPFQREDLHALTERLTDVIDDLRHGAELLVVLHPDVIPDQLVAHSRVVADAADQARMLVSQLPAGAAGRRSLTSTTSNGRATPSFARPWAGCSAALTTTSM